MQKTSGKNHRAGVWCGQSQTNVARTQGSRSLMCMFHTLPRSIAMSRFCLRSSQQAKAKGLGKSGRESVDGDRKGWGSRRACIADKALMPTETPMRPLCTSKHWRASRHDEIFWWHGSHGHRNRFAAHDLEPCAPDLTAWPVFPQDWPQRERFGRLEGRFRPT